MNRVRLFDMRIGCSNMGAAYFLITELLFLCFFRSLSDCAWSVIEDLGSLGSSEDMRRSPNRT